MASTRIDYTTMEWSSAVPFYGPAAVYDGKDIVLGCQVFADAAAKILKSN